MNYIPDEIEQGILKKVMLKMQPEIWDITNPGH